MLDRLVLAVVRYSHSILASIGNQRSTIATRLMDTQLRARSTAMRVDYESAA